MAGVAVASLLEKLSRLRTHHAHLISGIHKEVELLQIDLPVLKEFLLEHDGKLEEDEYWALRREIKRETKEFDYKDKEALARALMRRVEREIKECVYEVEDTIDTNLTQNEDWRTERKKRKELLFSDWKMKTLLRRIGELKEVIGKRFPASSKLPTIQIDNVVDRDHEEKTIITQLPPIQIDNVMMGRDFEEERIISYLMKSSDKLGVISIKGEAGLGKTTLARRIYVNTKIAYEFPVRIWIKCVSYSFFKLDVDVDDILRYILRVFTSQDIDSLSHEELSENVLACLEKKKFLLVMDDMPRHWRRLQNVLSKSDGMGKVLITTYRTPTTADCKMRLEPLSGTDSWKLFQLKVFGDLKCCPPELEDIGRAIADQCWGRPLLINLVGGILMGQLMKSSNVPNPIKDVLEVYENVYKDLHEVSWFPSDVVLLAYYRLSDELRQCFLYMGVFPEDYEISAWTLTRLWIAEGFVRPMEGHSLEEAATHNLDHLIRMGLVMVDKTNPFGKVKTCRVHGMISMQAAIESMQQELFQPLHSGHYSNTCRRLCVLRNDDDDTDLLSRVLKISGVRSVLCFSESPTGLDLNGMSTILNTFHLLKVLDSKSIKFHILPQQITKLFHLRYVTLCIDILNTLPESLSELWNLETLVVDTKSREITMEANIWRLIWLRHFKTNAAIVLASNNQGQRLARENLQTLTRLSPKSCRKDVFERANKLKSLGIRGDLKNLFGKKFLERLDHLEKLKLIHDVYPQISSENPLHKLPEHNCFPPKLKWLTLSQTHLVWDIDMPKLAKIKTLEVLKLKDDAFTGVIWRESGDCFPSLKFFLIENTDLVLWKASTDLLPKLSCLVLKNCENLIEIPEAVAEKLERLEIEHLGKSAVDSARRIADRKQQAQEKENVDRLFKLYIGPGCY